MRTFDPPFSSPIFTRAGTMTSTWHKWFVNVSKDLKETANEFEQISQQLSETTAQLTQVAQELAGAQDAITTAQAAITQAQSDITTAQSDITTAQAAITQAQQDLSTKVDNSAFESHNHNLADLTEKNYASLDSKPTGNSVTVVTGVDFVAETVTTETINFLEDT